MSKESKGTLKPTEPHPMACYARKWILDNYTIEELYIELEALSSCAIEGNRVAEICADTLDRMLRQKPYSDRYIMGLAWFLMRQKLEE